MCTAGPQPGICPAQCAPLDLNRGPPQLLLGFTDQVEELLRRGPPPYLRQLTDKLEANSGRGLPMMDSNPALVVALLVLSRSACDSGDCELDGACEKIRESLPC